MCCIRFYPIIVLGEYLCLLGRDRIGISAYVVENKVLSSFKKNWHSLAQNRMCFFATNRKLKRSRSSWVNNGHQGEFFVGAQARSYLIKICHTGLKLSRLKKLKILTNLLLMF